MQHLVLGLGLALLAALPVTGARAEAAQEATLQEFRFGSIDGGEIGFADWTGRPVLVANTASLCGFTPQLADLQALWETYGERGLVVLAVPSDSFRQELGSEKEVSEFCTIQYGITLPMTAITPVTGPEAHPFFAWLRDTEGFEPRWNFNKVLIGADGTVKGTWGSGESPTGSAITGAIEAALGS
ncbi:glutathione peroxidase [Rubellimicrobium roseum]|uniref:Glutathione peroxidase n=1 Tax=Rubellimicrobium roseum TaxID=687525 RepID=A0A5C4NBG1_9RHOB|nr:glutathione peroxidase [Rubellimicrobium roseum]TNC70971.1 glutathione peroxidase [Rubellimicrobium roseum]